MREFLLGQLQILGIGVVLAFGIWNIRMTWDCHVVQGKSFAHCFVKLWSEKP